MTDDDLPGMSDEELGQYVRGTPVFRLAVACARFEDGVQEIRNNDEIAWRHLMDETKKNQSRGNVKSRQTIEDVVNAFLDSIEEYAALARRPEDVADRAAEELVDDDDGEA